MLIAEAAVALSTLELPQDRRAAVNPAPIAAQPPPFLALLCLKSPIQRLESLIIRATIGLPCLNSPRNDCRGEITQGSNRPLLPARHSGRGCRPQRQSQAQAQAEQSTHARKQGNAGTSPTPILHGYKLCTRLCAKFMTVTFFRETELIRLPMG
ncbi:hypothetical protein GW17_00062253 [Ensete ventricosum]|nr:hypothetical protein GW17_00062253 [Ensete ventricosum]